jgi:hypothetical protein
VRVSKTWYTLASPFLYEYILLGKGKAVAPLLRGMHRTEPGVKSEDTTRPIGRWTKRLDVNFRDSTSNARADMDALADLMTHLPNLRVLTFSITGHQYKKILPGKILESVSCRETLKFVHFYTYCRPPSESWAAFLEQHPYLESVDLNYWLFDGMFETRLDFLRTVHLNTVPRSLVKTFPEDPTWCANFPAVRAVTYDMEFNRNDDEQVQRFFTAVGPKLTTIQLNQLYFDQDNYDVLVSANMDNTLGWILRECHVLKRIILLFSSWYFLAFFEDSPAFPSQVSTLVIRIIKYQISKKMTAYLFQRIFPLLKRRNPNLKTIQFSSGINIRGLRAHSKALAEGLRRMSDIGLVILDDEGCIME